MLAQHSLPATARLRLSVTLSRLLTDPAVMARLARIGTEPMKGDAGTLAQLLSEEPTR